MIAEITVTRTGPGLGMPQAYRSVKKAVREALQAEGVTTPVSVSVLLTDDAHIRELNRDFRDIDRPTDVLSFPASEQIPGAFDPDLCDEDPETGRLLLGDMALSLERVESQAAEYGHSTERELMYLTVHSVLHLLGYDHTDEGPEKARMREREKLIMTRLGRGKEREDRD
ncbi:MAG: rRNA maturation RNase YbeY [Oscillospiraceae bacterium]|nr:rRNA maturation RNase YbeY [Oscillospiraceae bacterium]